MALALATAAVLGCQSVERPRPSDNVPAVSGPVTGPVTGSAAGFADFVGCWAAPVDGFCIARGSNMATVTWRSPNTGVQCTAQARLTLLATNSIQISQQRTPRACTNGDDFVAQEYYCNRVSPTQMDCWNVYVSGTGQEQRVTVVFHRT